jgi:hypothetical protein
MLVPFFVVLVAAAVFGWLRASSLEARAVRRWNEVQRGVMPADAQTTFRSSGVLVPVFHRTVPARLGVAARGAFLLGAIWFPLDAVMVALLPMPSFTEVGALGAALALAGMSFILAGAGSLLLMHTATAALERAPFGSPMRGVRVTLPWIIAVESLLFLAGIASFAADQALAGFLMMIVAAGYVSVTLSLGRAIRAYDRELRA